jgi:hypothetical protein
MRLTTGNQTDVGEGFVLGLKLVEERPGRLDVWLLLQALDELGEALGR